MARLRAERARRGRALADEVIDAAGFMGELISN